MKITEIERVDQGGVNLSKLIRVGETSAGFNGEIDGFDFFKNQQDRYYTYYLIGDNNQIAAATVGTIHFVNGKQYFQINGVFVLPRYRGKRLATKMYHSIMHADGYHLMSDSKQTPSGEKLWKALDRAFTIKVMDRTSGDIISDELNDAYDDSENTVLVTEDKIQNDTLLIPTLKIRSNR